MKKQKTYLIKTLGCRANQYESAAYIQQLESKGYRKAQLGEKADVCIVNTCTVTHQADKDSRYQVRSIGRQYPGTKVIVTGCSQENDPFSFLEMEEVETTFSNQNKQELLPVLFADESWPEFSIEQFAAHTRAFVKIQDGCNSYCSYCIIPFVRGRSRSRTTESILKEIEGLVAKGYKEIVLTGINIGDFDGQDGSTLADLVQRCDQIEGLKRIRISSIDPDEVDDALLEAVSSCKHTCPSMHIVLQSGSNAILKRMNRKYTTQMFTSAVRRLQQDDPDFTITTDVIVGFPGETEKDFQDTLDFVDKVQFAKVHVFPYSPRKRTRAYSFTDRVPPQVINARKTQLIHAAEQAAFALREKFIGRTFPVLVETNKGSASGYTHNFIPVILDTPDVRPNTILDVELIENTPEGLRGKVVEYAS